MNRTMITVLIAGLVVALGMAAPAPAFAGARGKQLSITVDDDGNEKVEVARKIRIRTTDENGNTQEETLELDGSQGFLGVTLANTKDDSGVKVLGVMEDSGAEEAGLEKGDVIVGINGKDVRTPFELTREMAGTSPGDTVDIEFLRDGDRRTVTAELGESRGLIGLEGLAGLGELRHLRHLEGLDLEDLGVDLDDLAIDLGDLDIDLGDLDIDLGDLHESLAGLGHHGLFVGSRPKLGVQLVDATPDLREHMGAPRDAGVLVGKVLEGMPAEDAGVAVGDLIVGIDGEDVSSPGDLIHALHDKSGETVVLDVIRDGRSMSIDAFIPAKEAEEED